MILGRIRGRLDVSVSINAVARSEVLCHNIARWALENDGYAMWLTGDGRYCKV